MPLNEREGVLITCFNRARKRITGVRNDSFNKHYYAEGLVEIWAAFDAFLAMKFPAPNNTEMRSLLCLKYQPIFERWKKSDNYEKSISRVQELSPIKDMSPQNPRKDARLDDKNNLSDILYASYRVRSNYDHGGKLLEGSGPVTSRNRELIEHSLRVTYEILDRILRNEGLAI